ncbi:MAG TPA: hypothetical protein VMV14_11250 [Acidimicrobiales bacterium]|nr:hypothetical protein [Acidimicrobiales bacterium]
MAARTISKGNLWRGQSRPPRWRSLPVTSGTWPSLAVLGAVGVAALAGTPALLPVAAVTASARPMAASPAVVSGAAGVRWPVAATADANPLGTPAGPDPSATAAMPTGSCSTVVGGGATTGEGVLSLTMDGPGTEWSSAANTSVVVDTSVDGATPQEIVLYAGAQPFTYQGFVGTIATGPHCVALTVRNDLSHVTTVGATVDVFDVSLVVVPVGSSQYLLETHNPVLFGRSTSAVGDTPLLAYGQQSADPDGHDVDLAYTIVWTHEDVGDGVVPAYEWGLWGRMTDIETVLYEKVTPSGSVVSASYDSCGCEQAPVYPDIVPDDPAAGGETNKPYPATGYSPGLGEHLGLRDATGNNDISPSGTSSFRFQQTLVTGPAAGQAREVSMDQNPWTFRISGEEVGRESVQSTDAHNFLAGVYPQYLIVDIDAHSVGTSSIAVGVQLSGDPTWYSDDYAQMTAPAPASTFPFYNGGHARTVIKLPLGWNGTPIVAVRLVLNAPPGGPIPKLVGAPSIELIEVTPSYTVLYPSFPSPLVVAGTQLVPPGLIPS